MTDIPELQDFKLYLDKVLNFTSRVITDDHIQLTFLNNKLNNKMLKIFYAAYIVNTNNILPAQNYNELLMAQHAFLQTLNMFVFVSMNDEFTYTLNELKTEFNQLCKSLNTNIINKINEIDPDDYHIATGRLPTIDEPVGVNAYDYDINV
jgi:capsule polysaccharide export protein KpsC/LpsZ